MADIVLGIFLLGAVALATRALGGRRAVRPRIVPTPAFEPRAASFVGYEPTQPAPEIVAPVAPADPAGAPSYLLGGRPAGPDATAAILAMMAGPGLCTPRDPSQAS